MAYLGDIGLPAERGPVVVQIADGHGHGGRGRQSVTCSGLLCYQLGGGGRHCESAGGSYSEWGEANAMLNGEYHVTFGETYWQPHWTNLVLVTPTS